jgi:hypothetical protein
MNSIKTELNVLDQTNILLVKNVFSETECKEITEAILKYKGTPSPKDNIVVNNGLWSGHPHIHDGFALPLTSIIIARLKDACTLYYNSLPKPLNITRLRKDICMSREDWDMMLWAGVTPPGSENREHTHTKSFISGTVYFQSEGTGTIEFMPYNYVYRSMLPQWPYYGFATYEPKDGDILLFPSYLLHKVERNPSEFDRVNISFNAIPMTGSV